MKRIYLFIFYILTITSLACASPTQTMISFANPSNNASDPLITVDFTNNLISGGWDDSKTGLDLVAHFLGGTTYHNTWFVISPTVYTDDTFNGQTDSGGSIQFYQDNTPADQPLMMIEYDYATLSPGGLFADEVFTLGDIDVSGPITEGFNFTQESISFSLANQHFIDDNPQNGFTATASFDSSAKIVPEPLTLTLLGLGGSVLILKRKRQA